VQRWRAARLAGLTTVPVAVRTVSCEIYDQVAENLKRHGISPLELARFIRGRVDAGESNAHIARKLAVDATTVTHHLSLLELPPVLNAALVSGRCTAPAPCTSCKGCMPSSRMRWLRCWRATGR